MMDFAKSTALCLTLALAGCAMAPEPAPVAPMPQVPAGIDPITGLPMDMTPGLNDREPDTCKAADYRYLIGQNEAAVNAAGITRPTRFVTPGGIVSQEEYNSFRINFQLDAVGNVVGITCG
ncbi:MAG: hypothetical protein LBE86_00780 [Gemmobacter sp.]|nr:hypothetical protein [Gemmobacter sp.]